MNDCYDELLFFCTAQVTLAWPPTRCFKLKLRTYQCCLTISFFVLFSCVQPTFLTLISGHS